jgi:stage II sporulation protein M
MKPKEPYYFTIISLLFLSMVFGYLVGMLNLPKTQSIISETINPLRTIRELPPFFLFIFIFLNNTLKAFATIILGIFFGLFSMYFIVINGFFIGIIASLAVSKNGWPVVLAGILPHGFFEISGIIMAASYGLWLGYKFYRRARYNELSEFGTALRLSMRQFFNIIVPILLFAAFIETFLTPHVIQFFSK